MAFNDRELIYYKLMEKALEDNYLSVDESNILQLIRARMDISPETIDAMIAHFKGLKRLDEGMLDLEHLNEGALAGKYRAVFKAIVKEALADEQITRDEFALINELRDILGITQNERQRIYNEVRQELAGQKSPPTIMARVQSFLIS